MHVKITGLESFLINVKSVKLHRIVEFNYGFLVSDTSLNELKGTSQEAMSMINNKNVRGLNGN